MHVVRSATQIEIRKLDIHPNYSGCNTTRVRECGHMSANFAHQRKVRRHLDADCAADIFENYDMEIVMIASRKR